MLLCRNCICCRDIDDGVFVHAVGVLRYLTFLLSVVDCVRARVKRVLLRTAEVYRVEVPLRGLRTCARGNPSFQCSVIPFLLAIAWLAGG